MDSCTEMKNYTEYQLIGAKVTSIVTHALNYKLQIRFIYTIRAQEKFIYFYKFKDKRATVLVDVFNLHGSGNSWDKN